MSEHNEPKDLMQAASDKFDELSKGGEQQEESSPQTEQTDVKVEGGSDPLKTQSTPETEDKGFASHPKWIERENKLKEAKDTLQAKELELKRYAELLDDPDVYAKWLKRQGYSEQEIRQAMADKGFQTKPNEAETRESRQANAIAEKACKKLGWDITRLNQEQKNYINDHVSLTMEVLEATIGPMLDSRLGPMEEASNEFLAQKQFNAEDLAVRELAKNELPGMDFDKVIKPAIEKYLQELDQKDPKKTIKLSYEDIYYRATRPLLREQVETKGRQEVRNTNKANARPLGTGTATRTEQAPQRGKSVRDAADEFLSKAGVS